MANKKLVSGITIHSIVKNEPFIYYAIKSVYPYVDKILLYDTGSNEVNIIRKMTEIENESLDFALIDPVKGEYSRAYQAGLVIPKIKKGGWLILDNYGYENMAEIISPAWRVLTFDDIRWHGNGTRFYQKANQ